MAQGECYDLYFTGRTDDPRNVQFIGHEGPKPVLYTFTTATGYNMDTRTTIVSGRSDLVAHFDWDNGTHLGTAVVGSRRFSMTQLVSMGASPGTRRFTHDNMVFEWRKTATDTYDLYASSNIRLAIYRPKNQTTSVGPSHGYFQYSFSGYETLLLESLLALAVNRWIERYGL
ncbi:hypothetical protein SISNIDRAFT_447837 [Sistotremastrum niveocremeum HHB9708]|uniref:DUF6593 domain-containing protein n=1 Tax=Sistotremastrum niveocremeum HHB9708 TaxID=1314777 RepID=A0A165AHK1_9AGAM|nr:hypothetical protein SISNIDRAFT_447837 [Sistotremastrum niveocremeum HHB9708]